MKEANDMTDTGQDQSKPVTSQDLITLIDKLLVDGSLVQEMSMNEKEAITISFQNLFSNPEIKCVVAKLQDLGKQKLKTDNTSTKQSQNLYQLKQKIESEALKNLQNGKPDFNSQKVIIKPGYKTTFQVTVKDADSSELSQKLHSKLTGLEIGQQQADGIFQVRFESVDSVKAGVKVLREVCDKVEESHDKDILQKLLAQVKKNPCTETKKPQVSCTDLTFMCLGIDDESPVNGRKHTNSLFVGESENLALKEEISENVMARQRIYSEQVFDQSQPQETVGYQSKFQHYTTQQIIDAYKAMLFKPPEESPLFEAPEYIKWSIHRDQPRGLELATNQPQTTQVQQPDDPTLERTTVLTGNFPKKAERGLFDAITRQKRTVSETDQNLLQFNANAALEKSVKKPKEAESDEDSPKQGHSQSGKSSGKARRKRQKQNKQDKTVQKYVPKKHLGDESDFVIQGRTRVYSHQV